MSATSDLAECPPESAPAPRFLEAGTATLALDEDRGEGAPIVLLHGGPGVPDCLGPVAALLRGRHRVVRYDQRRTGRSACTTGD